MVRGGEVHAISGTLRKTQFVSRRTAFFTAGDGSYRVSIDMSTLGMPTFWHESAETGTIFEPRVPLASGH